jgi:hypothetical protein
MIPKQGPNPGKTQEEIIIQTMISGLSTSRLGKPDSFSQKIPWGVADTHFLDEYIL